MHPAGRIILAALAAFILWTLVRAFRRGVIYSGGYSFALDDSPMLFTLAAIVHAVVWLVARSPTVTAAREALI